MFEKKICKDFFLLILLNYPPPFFYSSYTHTDHTSYNYSGNMVLERTLKRFFSVYSNIKNMNPNCGLTLSLRISTVPETFYFPFFRALIVRSLCAHRAFTCALRTVRAHRSQSVHRVFTKHSPFVHLRFILSPKWKDRHLLVTRKWGLIACEKVERNPCSPAETSFLKFIWI